MSLWESSPLVSEDIPAVRTTESNNNPDAYNAKSGAKGAMQVLDTTNTQPGYGVAPAGDDSQAERERVGQDYLSAMQQRYGRVDGLIAYNWGPGNFERWDRDGRDPAKLPEESRQYVAKVTGTPLGSGLWQTSPLADAGKPQQAPKPPMDINVGLYGGKPATERFGEAVAGGAGRVRDTVFPPADPTTLFSQDQESANRATRQRQADVAAYEKKRQSGELGSAGTFGDIVPEMALSAVPVARTGEAVASMLPRALGRFAPAAGDVAANAAYSGGSTALTGGSPSDVLQSTLLGAAGAAGGRAVAKGASMLPKAVGRLRPEMTPEVSTLRAAGIDPTISQAFPESLLGRAEQAATGIPFLGSAIERAQSRAGSAYAGVELNRAISGLGETVTGVDRAAVERANQIVSKAYEDIIPHTFLRSRDLDNALQVTRGALDNIPLLSDAQRAQFLGYINQKLQPLVQQGRVLPGRLAKDIDIEVGGLARKFAKSSEPTNASMADAFTELHKNLRGALDAPHPTVLARLKASNEAYRNMISINKAFNRATVPTPEQFRKAFNAAGQKPGPLNQAAGAVIQPTAKSGKLTRNVLGGVSVAHPGAIVGAAALAALGRVLYSPAVVHAVLTHLPLQPHIASWLSTLPLSKQREYILRLAKQSPSTAQLAAQVGRQLATQPEETTP